MEQLSFLAHSAHFLRSCQSSLAKTISSSWLTLPTGTTVRITGPTKPQGAAETLCRDYVSTYWAPLPLIGSSQCYPKKLWVVDLQAESSLSSKSGKERLSLSITSPKMSFALKPHFLGTLNESLSFLGALRLMMLASMPTSPGTRSKIVSLIADKL